MSGSEPDLADNLRKKAESLLAKSPEDYDPADVKDVNTLAHELAVHQAELELQNEELRNTQLALQHTRDHFTDLYNNAPVGYVVLDGAGMVRQTNRTWCVLLNREEEDLAGRPFAEAIVPEDAPVFRARFRAFFRNPADKRIVVRMKRRGSAPFHACIEARPRVGENITVGDDAMRDELLVIVSDVTELERERQRAARLNGILRAIRNVNQLITKEDDPQRLIVGACANLTETLSYHNAWVALFDGSGAVTAMAQSGLDGAFGPLREKLQRGEFTACVRQSLKDDGVVATADPVSECSDCPLAVAYDQHAGLTRCLTFGGKTYGALAVSVPPAYADDVEEQALFDEVAGDIAFALHKIETVEQARRDRERMHFVIAGARLGTWEWNVRTGETVFNENWATMLGYTLDELMPCDYATWERLVHPEDIERATEALQRCVAGQTPDYNCEFRMRHRDGRWVWVLDRGRIMTRDADGTPLSMFGTHTDITQIRERQERIAMFGRMLDDAPAAIVIHDTDGNFLFSNRQNALLHGYESAAEFLALNLHALDVPESAALLAERLRQIAEHGEARFEVEHFRKDGSTFPLEVTAKMIEWLGQPALLSIAIDITERKRAEVQVREMAERLRAASEASLDAFFICRAERDKHGQIVDFVFVHVNARAADMLQMSPEEVLGQHMCELLPVNRSEGFFEKYRRVVETGEPLEEEFYLGESHVPAGWHYHQVVKTGDGIAISHRNIDERKKVAQALADSEERFRSFFTNLSAGSCIDEVVYENGRAVDYRILDVNPAYERIMGIPREKVAGALGSQAYGLSKAPFLDRLERVAETGVPERFEAFFEPIGKHLDLTVTRPAPGMFSTVFFDITDQRLAEQDLARSRRELQAIYDSAPVMLCVVDQGRRVLHVNQAFSSFVGQSEDALRGGVACGVLGCTTARESDGGCGHGPDCDACALLRALEDTLATGTSHTGIERRLTLERYGDRSEITLLGATAAIQRADGNHALLCLTDITDSRALETQLSQAQKMESVGRLAGGVAHDFNNMLMVILGQAQMLARKMAADDAKRRHVAAITEAGQRSANLTRQLLAFARKETIAPVPLQLNDAVAALLSMLRRLIGEDIDLSWQPGHALWPVKMDPSQLDQILANLCVNARDAIEGVGKITIETANADITDTYCRSHTEAKLGQFVVLAISDDGCGMDRDTLAQVFEPFFTTKPAGIGTGLGLAMVYGIVKQNGGFVNVYSEPGEGTTFRIYLPRLADEAVLDDGRQLPDEYPRGSETVLLVEDEPPVREVAQAFLEDLGYRVLAADGPAAALELAAAETGSIDLLLTDVVMPDLSGRDLAERLAAERPSLKVLYMSGYTANTIAHRGVLDKEVQFIGKPFTQEELARKVRHVLDG